MSDPKLNVEAAPEVTPANPRGLTSLLRRIRGLVGRVRTWTGGNRTRSIAVAVALLILILATIAGWAFLANIAMRSGQQSVAAAMEALNQGRYEEARAIVGRLFRSGELSRSEYGGPLFVLGTVKIHDAESNPSPERRRGEYLVASRYLKEARAYGFPIQQQVDGQYLLGLSSIKCSQFDEGIQVFDELLAQLPTDDEPLNYRIHALLAETCLLMPRPKLQPALEHNEAVLRDPELTDELRADALLQQSDCLARLSRFDDARRSLAAVPDVANRRAAVHLMQGRITLDELEAALRDAATDDRDRLISEWKPKTDAALQELQQAESLDAQAGFVSRQASYQLARGRDLQGDQDAALRQFTLTRQQYPDSLEGLAANLGEADLLRQKSDFDAALLGYRRVLETYPGRATYRSDVLALDELRSRVLAAVSDFVDRQRFKEALVILERLSPMFSKAEQLEIQGDTLQQWGYLELGKSSDDDWQSTDDHQLALHHLRAAGHAYEQLAELRFDSGSYPQDLWKSAENYYRGHNFTRTIQQLTKYLQNEPKLRNAAALLRLGQAHLALGQVPESIAALEECIEFHPRDSATYQARIDGAKAYWHQGNTERAEQLLRDNITGSTLKPTSREWKDSLFELGMLLYETNRHEQAIGTLEEAVERYPDDFQTLLAQYVIGESYRRWAEELLQRVRASRTSSEREKNQQLASARLTTALEHFEEVQRNITLGSHDVHKDPLMGTMLRNCYMLEGTVLFDLGRYKEAIEAYSNVSSLYPDEPFVLETFVQIANCWRRLEQSEKARGAIRQAQIALDRLPAEANFTTDTAFTRDEWRMLLTDMRKW